MVKKNRFFCYHIDSCFKKMENFLYSSDAILTNMSGSLILSQWSFRSFKPNIYIFSRLFQFNRTKYNTIGVHFHIKFFSRIHFAISIPIRLRPSLIKSVTRITLFRLKRSEIRTKVDWLWSIQPSRINFILLQPLRVSQSLQYRLFGLWFQMISTNKSENNSNRCLGIVK